MALSADSGMKVSPGDPTSNLPDDDDSDGDSAKGGGSTLKVLGILVCLVILAAGLWIGFGERIMAMMGPSDGDVPVIAANPAPIKVRPESPGGMQVPNQGRLVYGVVDGSSAQPRVERLLPSPEKPMAVDEVLKRGVPEASEVASANAPRGTADTNPSGPVRLTPSLPSAEDVAKMAPPAPAPAPQKSTTSAPAPAPEAAPAPVAAAPAPPPVPTAAPKAVATPAAPTPKATRTAQATPVPAAPTTDLEKSYRVQLAASRTESAVRSEWDRLRRRHIDLLGELNLQVMKIDLGGTKGIFYRLRAGPLSNAASAKALCERLKQRKLGCLVVKPGA